MPRKIYPPDGRLLFDGGLNTKFERSIIPDNESPDCLNVVFTNGAVETREGTTKLNSTSIDGASFVVDGLYTRREDEGAETMVAFAGGSAWTWDGSTFTTIGSAQSVFTAGMRVAAAQTENHIFMGTGGIIPYKYNGTDFTRHGVYPATTTMTVATAPTGANLTGDYRYQVVFVNSNLVQSDVSPTTATFAAAGEDIRLTGIPVAPQSHGISTRRLYRTDTSGTVFKRLATIADNVTTTYDDGVPDASLGANAPSDNGVPPNYSMALFHANRLFVNDPDNPNFVYYSNINDPYTFGAANFVRVGDASADVVKGLAVHEDSVVALCEKTPFLIYMPSTDATTWNVIKTNSPFGSRSPFAPLNVDNRLLFPAMDAADKFVGFASLLGTIVEPTATTTQKAIAGSQLKSDRIEPDMFDVVESQVGNISAIVFKNKAYITLTKSSGTENNRVYVMDFSISNVNKSQKEAWVPWTGIKASQFTILDGKLYYGSADATGFVYQMNDGSYNDDGAAIDSYFWTKEFVGSKAETSFHKDWRFSNLLVEKVGDWFMNLRYRTDSDDSLGNVTTIDLDPGGSQWGTMEWGTDEWGGGTKQEDKRVFLGTSKGERIQFRFDNQNTVDQWFRVHWMNIVYNLKGYR